MTWNKRIGWSLSAAAIVALTNAGLWAQGFGREGRRRVRRPELPWI